MLNKLFLSIFLTTLQLPIYGFDRQFRTIHLSEGKAGRAELAKLIAEDPAAAAGAEAAPVKDLFVFASDKVKADIKRNYGVVTPHEKTVVIQKTPTRTSSSSTVYTDSWAKDIFGKK